jgi:hypothetical protein
VALFRFIAPGTKLLDQRRLATPAGARTETECVSKLGVQSFTCSGAVAVANRWVVRGRNVKLEEAANAKTTRDLMVTLATSLFRILVHILPPTLKST